jgi:hypothetical protein
MVMTSSTLTGQAKLVNPAERRKRWILSPASDCLLLHGALGLFAIALTFGSHQIPNSVGMWLFAYSLFLGLPHLAATYLRLGDPDCRVKFAWLVRMLPLAVCAIVSFWVFALAGLATVVLLWFLLQAWHISAQTYGILRRYMRMAGSAPEEPVNRLAEFLVTFAPWTFVLIASMRPTQTYVGFPIDMAPVIGMAIVIPVLCGLTVVATVSYLFLELRDLRRGIFVPGRFITVAGLMLTFAIAFLGAIDLTWAYLAVTTYHAVQYITYTSAFRLAPPPGYNPVRLSICKQLAILLCLGAAMKLVLLGFETWLPALLIITHFSVNFHHFVCDTFIWKRPGLVS